MGIKDHMDIGLLACSMWHKDPDLEKRLPSDIWSRFVHRRSPAEIQSYDCEHLPTLFIVRTLTQVYIPFFLT